MNRKVPYDQLLIFVVLALLGTGLVLVFSASSFVSKDIYGSSTSIFTKQVISILIGLALLLIAMHTDYHLYARTWLVYGSLAAAVVLLAWVLLSPDVNGVNRWLVLGPIRFQPSEAAKLTVLLLTAHFLARRNGRVTTFDRDLLVFLAMVGVLVVLVLLEPDFGTSTSLLATVALLLFLAGLHYRYYLASLLPAIPLFYFLVYRVPYRRDRILAFLDPEADPFGSGYQILQSLLAVGSGSLTGKGLAQGTQKLFFLPEPHTDFIFAVLGEEFGLVGCSIVTLLFLVFFWRGVQISLRADSLFGTYLGLGIVTMIVFQAFFNMSVVLGLCPTKGIPLPFVSAGGSSILIMLTAFGILLNISRHTRSRSAVQPSAAVTQERRA